jgi:hypothetical protein
LEVASRLRSVAPVGASYTELIVIPVYVYALGIYNEKIEAIRAWLSHAQEDANAIGKFTANAVLAHLHQEPIPGNFFLLFYFDNSSRDCCYDLHARVPLAHQKWKFCDACGTAANSMSGSNTYTSMAAGRP